jgi:hypothetical protein
VVEIVGPFRVGRAAPFGIEPVEIVAGLWDEQDGEEKKEEEGGDKT